jgi:ketosteroid isomerase-like protein
MRPSVFNKFPGNVFVIAALAAATIPYVFAQKQVPEVDAVLNDLHDAASRGDYNRYFSHFSDDAVFLGTDPDERWTTSQFRIYAKPRFERGGGWTYTPVARHVYLSKDRQVAWFDESLNSKKYGNMRGTGVLVKSGTTWKLTQYNLLKPIPNDSFVKVVEMIEAQRPGNSNQRPKAPPH